MTRLRLSVIASRCYRGVAEVCRFDVAEPEACREVVGAVVVDDLSQLKDNVVDC